MGGRKATYTIRGVSCPTLRTDRGTADVLQHDFCKCPRAFLSLNLGQAEDFSWVGVDLSHLYRFKIYLYIYPIAQHALKSLQKPLQYV